MIDEDFHFNREFALGMEVTAGIAAESFDKVVDAFGQIGGTNVATQDARKDSGDVLDNHLSARMMPSYSTVYGVVHRFDIGRMPSFEFNDPARSSLIFL